MDHYIVVFIYSKHKYYFIWKSDENDVFLTQNDKIIFWNDICSLNEFCEINNINFADEKEIVYNIDCCENWCNSIFEDIDCSTILNLRNIFSDLHSSVGVEFEGVLEHYNSVYDKLFYGNNLPCINTTSKKYLPTFDDEIQRIKEMMMKGINLFKRIISLEGFNRQLRKVTKNKSVFPTDDSLLKMLYLAMIDITKKWTGKRKDWGQIHSQLEIFFADRLPQ